MKQCWETTHSHYQFSEEGTLAKVLTMLCWLFNLQLLTIALPKDKFLAWRSDLRKVINSKRTAVKELYTLLGWLNHASCALPLAGYFLNRIRSATKRQGDNSQKARHASNEISSSLSKAVIADLQLFTKTFLPNLHQGISLNLLTFCWPTHIFWRDAWCLPFRNGRLQSKLWQSIVIVHTRGVHYLCATLKQPPWIHHLCYLRVDRNPRWGSTKFMFFIICR